MQIENQEKREEEDHLAELTATAKNDEEVIAKLHKVVLQMCWLGKMYAWLLFNESQPT